MNAIDKGNGKVRGIETMSRAELENELAKNLRVHPRRPVVHRPGVARWQMRRFELRKALEGLRKRNW